MVNLLNGDILHNKELIFYGIGSRADNMERIYESYGYYIKYFCYSNAHGNGEELHHGKRVLSFQELIYYCKVSKENVIIQIASSFEREILECLQQEKIKASLLVYNDFRFFIRDRKISYLEKMNKNYRKQALLDYANNRKYFARNLAWELLDNYNLEKDILNIIYSSPKTGSTTLAKSFSASKNIIEPIYVSYSMNPFSKEYLEVISKCKKRFIGGVREPISQMLSLIFFLWYTRDSMFDSANKYMNIGDCQYWFDEHFINKGNEENALEIFCKIMETTCNEIDFYENEYFHTTGINLFKYSFDKDKGYTIIKEGNTEILIYRLDKLNNLVQIIGDYFGDDNFQIIDANKSENSIYAEMYRKAKNSIKIKKEFLEKCYNSKLIRWCYTNDEIEKFKLNWNNNIIK